MGDAVAVAEEEKEKEKERKGSVRKSRQRSEPDLLSSITTPRKRCPRATRTNSLPERLSPPRADALNSNQEDACPKHQRQVSQGWREAKPLTLSDHGKDSHQNFNIGSKNRHRSGAIEKDGRLRITLDNTAYTGYLVNALGTTLSTTSTREGGEKIQHDTTHPSASANPRKILTRQRLNIVIMIVGSRGDIQPFLKIGKILKEEHGHRVRIATHPVFRDLVEKDSGLEFFSVSGNPAELMAFMVKNPGLLPSFETIMAGDVSRRRAAMAEMFDGFWRACIDATDGDQLWGTKEPFVADAIIANPPSIMHVHCAEALGIPLHIMFTFPYTPTQAFPHPLTCIKNSDMDDGYTNFISYPLVEMVVWQGLGDLVNEIRTTTLRLDPVSTVWAVGAAYRMHIPFTYLWSPDLVPKPEDWGSEIDIAGFVFLDRATSFQPSRELEAFLAAGEPPIYIGFGSIIVDDADRFTRMIFKAVEMAGVRALISKGWGGLGLDNEDHPDIFMLGDTPHDWLFPRVSACVIHGGAGTTAIALKSGKPTMIVPFFGDQYFWGKMVSKVQVGPRPVPYKELDEAKLADGIKYCLTETAQAAAVRMAMDIAKAGDGGVNAVQNFHRQLDLATSSAMQCSILQNRVAVWQIKGTNVKLSALAADILVAHGLLSWKRLRVLRYVEWNDVEGPGEPLTGVASSLARSVGYAVYGIGAIPYHLAQKAHHSMVKAKWKMKQLTHLANANASNPTQSTPLSADHPTVREKADRCACKVRKEVERVATAILMAPVDLAMALGQGFHNAPRLYGDDTVRRPLRVTGYHSGLRAAGHEFVFGVYDGFTGVIRLPVRGAKDNGMFGFMKGTGRGLMGLVLKNLSAVMSPIAYTLKGIVREAERSGSPQMIVHRTRITQGQREHEALPSDSRRELTERVVAGWITLKNLCDVIADLKRKPHLRARIDMALTDTGVIFESVDIAERSLGALKRLNI
ncbi:uncharacterized protein BKA55DRAFT_523577 [Fusarium redolens]|uniref:Glycosyltransferase family 28 N-terminal domain-containing protein n=1 Tax=Fusarium redolens TaxID=48865 RepID=A0A9P9JXF8_FUSRE|nr:uncharacterized protein BKA55DRAFT_523577 [Fusarium redolens]KAH7232379.1 hypothetical protein BKA55DRAFT_523577 [Fusarium redolens]